MTDRTSGEEIPVAWTAIPEHEEVLSRDGRLLGTVLEVLGSPDEGIFHGLAVHSQLRQYPVSVPATSVASITNRMVTLNIDEGAFLELERYVPEESFKLGIKGLFFHRLGWKEDSNNRS